MPLLVVLACACFVAALSIRVIDPLVPEIARDLVSAPQTIAMLASAFAVPYALSQPFLGPLGDSIGKARVIKGCLLALLLSLIVSTVADSVEVLFISRIAAGLAGGGIIPVSFAIIGDRFDIQHRQVALSRVLGAMLTAILVGSVASGLIASAFGWRAVMGLAAAVTAVALVVAMVSLKPRENRPEGRFGLKSIIHGYRVVFQNPRAILCYVAVFVEGVFVFGLLPYIAVLLEQRGAGGVREAGFVLAGMGLGGVLYTVAVPLLLRLLGNMFNLIRMGGILAAIGYGGVALAGPWWIEMVAFAILGFGFYCIHNSLQTQATELAPKNRGAAVSLHAFFFFLGHAAGPPLYAVALGTAGAWLTLSSLVVIVPLLALLLAWSLQRLHTVAAATV